MANKCFVCVVGGTGSRVGNALVQTLFAGTTDQVAEEIDEICILSIDADRGSNDIKSLSANATSYQDFQNVIQKGAKAANVKLKFWQWTPTLPESGKLSEMTGKEKDAQDLLYALYDQNQQEIVINSESDGGFRANPNVGVCFLRASLKAEANVIQSEYISFKNSIREACNVGGNVVRLLMVGSLFGGTGAASFVCIAADLNRANEAKNPNYRCGAVMLTPYFAVRDKGHVDSDIMKGFYSSTKEALSYYNAHRKELPFSTFYLFGSPVLREAEWKAANQKNKASFVEAEAAQACLHYFTRSDLDVNDKVFYMRKNTRLAEVHVGPNETMRCPKEIELSLSDFGSEKGSLNKLLKMVRFAINYMYVVEPQFEGCAQMERSGKKGLPNYYTQAAKPAFEAHRNLRDQMWRASKTYLQWIHELLEDEAFIQKFLNEELLGKMIEALPDTRHNALENNTYKNMRNTYLQRNGKHPYAKIITVKEIPYWTANQVIAKLPNDFPNAYATDAEKFAYVLEHLMN